MSRFVDELTDQLWSLPSRKGEVFAILDAARDPAIFPLVATAPLAALCLYDGVIPRVLAENAPYLVPLRPWDAFTRHLLSHAWGKSWGVFVSSTVDAYELRRHLRRYLMVTDDKGKVMYFRYYDPRVLRVYLPTCNAGELDLLFGTDMIDNFACEAERRSDLIEWTRHGSRLAENRLSVAAVGARP